MPHLPCVNQIKLKPVTKPRINDPLLGTAAWRNHGVLLHANETGHAVNLDKLLCDTVELWFVVDKGLLLTKMPASRMHLVYCTFDLN